jgi:hypothetical protein
MQRDIKVGSISWINESPNPVWFSGKAAILDPAWVPKTYMGLAATANHKPPDTISDFKAYQNDKDFRALMYCHLRVTIDDSTKQISKVEVLDAVHDPGWNRLLRPEIIRWPYSQPRTPGALQRIREKPA